MEKFVLIDGNAILHRAYHALPPLTNKDGIVVNAVYGFCSMLLKVMADLKPTYLAVAFDRAAPTFRQELYVGYQAQRPKMAEGLSPQVDMVHQVLERMNVAIFEIDGYEADDVIGTLAYQVQSLETIIVTGDRDMLQLVNDHVKVYAPVVGLTKTILYDEKSVKEKYGIKPSQIVDYKALIGDPSDNYPGVTGIGPKTASELLRQYQTLENLYKNIGKLPPKIGERLATDIEQASLAKKLATIVTAAPLTLDIAVCSFKHFDIDGAKKAFEEFGFKSLLKRLPGYEEKSGEDGQKKTARVRKKSDNGQLGLL